MGYRERATIAPRPTIDISGVRYDIDYFGMDDGQLDAPDDAFRFVFQLGHHLMIHLYVIQAGGASAVDHEGARARPLRQGQWLRFGPSANAPGQGVPPPRA